MKMIKPALVLAIITTAVAALLIVTYKATYVDTSGIITDALQKCCEETMGEGDFEIVTDWKAAGYAIEQPESIAKLIKKSDGSVAFEIVADGYEKGGLDLLIAMNADGTVKDIAVVAISETPGLGSKVQGRSFLDQFRNAGGAVIAGGSSGGLYKGKKEADSSVSENAAQITAVTSATYSSAGVVEAVNLAVSTYAEMGGAQ